jgi:hypothetical protein
MSTEQRAFSVKTDGKAGVIKFQVGIAETLSNGSEPNQTAIKTYWAKVDTGANISLISDNVINALALEPTQYVQLQTNQGVDTQSQYIVDIYLPNSIRFTPIKAVGIKAGAILGVDCIIGMDILSNTDISLSYADNKTLFSLRVPASGGIDFVETIQKQQDTRSTKPAKRVVITDNHQPCPCGSGKKHKNCCYRL